MDRWSYTLPSNLTIILLLPYIWCYLIIIVLGKPKLIILSPDSSNILRQMPWRRRIAEKGLTIFYLISDQCSWQDAWRRFNWTKLWWLTHLSFADGLVETILWSIKIIYKYLLYTCQNHMYHNYKEQLYVEHHEIKQSFIWTIRNILNELTKKGRKASTTPN